MEPVTQTATQPTITHHGGASGVTSSCHQLHINDNASILIDYGLYQGEDSTADSLQQLRINFDIRNTIALVITHVYIDHSGRLPYLLVPGT